MTQDLTVGAIDQEFHKVETYAPNSGPGKSVYLGDIEGYTYKEGDIFLVYINGLMAIEGADYEMVLISEQPSIVFNNLNVKSQPCTVYVRILQSKASAGGGGEVYEASGIMTYGNPMVSDGVDTEQTLDPQFTAVEQ